MKHKPFLELLNAYQPQDSHEQHYKKKMITFANQYEDCFERSLSTGHFTASAWLVNKPNTHALLMHHAKLGIWVQLGGHCDGNPNVLDVAIKEAQEESGIKNITPVFSTIFDIDIHLIPANSKEPQHFHYDVRFLLQVTSNETLVQNHESKALQWIPKNSAYLPTQSHTVVRMFEKWVALKQLL